MSGLAHILKDRGFTVSGSDMKPSASTDALVSEGVNVLFGQEEGHIRDAHPAIDAVCYTAAIHPDNPEYIAAESLGIPMLSRAELLGQLMEEYPLPVAISGTHGKTTTTSMLSAILLEASLDPTLLIGGVYEPIGGTVRIGHSGYFVTEACEYTNSFLEFRPRIGVILNIEADHLDFFKDLEDVRRSFKKFALLLPKDGTLIINRDIPDLDAFVEGIDCNIVKFGGDLPEGLSLQVPGDHNKDNALAALAAADALGIERDISFRALHGFGGAERRFQYKGVFNGAKVYDDYAHHPTEIRAALTAAKGMEGFKRVICVFQSHTYTRTKALLDEFAEALTLADEVLIVPIFPARETDTLGMSEEVMAASVRSLGHTCEAFPDFSSAEDYLRKNCTKDDLLITMGAGDVVLIGERLVSG